MLWTRLAPEPLRRRRHADGQRRSVVAGRHRPRVSHHRSNGTAIARPELGHSVHVEADGLAPGREYFYRFRCGGEASQVGRTKTAPAAGAPVDRLRFGVCGCGHYETGYFTAYGRLAEELFDFVFHTGDYIYEGRGDAHRNPNNVRHHQGQEIYTLVDYRNRYAQYKSDPDLMAAHLSAPFIMTWDDHEVDNDYAGDRDERDTPPEVFLLRRAAAYQAYYESMPLRASPHSQRAAPAALSPSAVRQPDRPQRARHAAVSIESGGLRRSRTARSCSMSRRTILGERQEKWLFDNLSRPAATWTVLGQQVPTFARDMASANAAARYSVDKWDGYVGFAPAAVRPSSGRQGRRTRSCCPATCTRTGAPISRSTSAIPPRRRSASSSPTRRSRPAATAPTCSRRGNPSAATTRTSRITATARGYVACTATPKTMRADFRVIDKVTERDAAGADRGDARGRGRTARQPAVVTPRLTRPRPGTASPDRGTGRTPSRR